MARNAGNLVSLRIFDQVHVAIIPAISISAETLTYVVTTAIVVLVCYFF